MDIAKIFSSILDKPDIPKFYRELQSYYQKNNMLNESLSIGFLLENKFGKKNEESSHDNNVGEK